MFVDITDNPVHSKWIFYDTHFTRNDILNLIKLEGSTVEFKKYIVDNILIKWSQKDASENRNDVFADQLCQIYRFMNGERFTAEQKSCVMSLTYEIFIKSMEKKMTQIDSFNLLKQALQEQTKIYSTQTLPVIDVKQLQKIVEFIKESFYRYYSQYEITMTKFIDLSIFTNNKFEDKFPPILPLDGAKKIDNPQGLAQFKEIFFKQIQEQDENENDEEEEADGGEEEQSEGQLSIQGNDQQEQKRELNEEEQEIERYVTVKVGEYSNETTVKINQAQENALDQANNIINPPKKK